MSPIDREAVRWLVRNAGQHLDESERQAFAAWCAADIRHQGAYARATAIQNVVDRALRQGSPPPQPDRPDASWHTAQPRRRFLRVGAAAASTLALAGGAAVFVMQPDTTSYVTARGEWRTVPLADQSVVKLNSGSAIDVALSRAARNVALHRGEAWFDVAKDRSRPFTVAAGDAQVRAVGTAFGVRRFANGVEVAVSEGIVEIWNKGAAATIRRLAAGDIAFMPSGGGAIRVASQSGEIRRKLAWREGKVMFSNQTLDEAVAEYNRYSPRRIVVLEPRLGSRTLVGQYPINAPEVFAKDVSAFLAVPFAVTADRILIGAPRAAGSGG